MENGETYELKPTQISATKDEVNYVNTVVEHVGVITNDSDYEPLRFEAVKHKNKKDDASRRSTTVQNSLTTLKRMKICFFVQLLVFIITVTAVSILISMLLNKGYNKVDGQWGLWTSWGPCSRTCNKGTWSRTRLCTDPAPFYGGKHCSGNNTEKSECHLMSCPVNGAWSQWSAWSPCSKSCNGGEKKRNRSCSNPYPTDLGRQCEGNSEDITICSLFPCLALFLNDSSTKDGGWSPWSPWSSCSISCNGGERRRQRTCSNPQPTGFGKQCLGNSNDIGICSTNPCGVNGGWSPWSSWSSCSKSCNSGERKRNRSCSNPYPDGLGRQCLGNSDETNTCNGQPCPDYKSTFRINYPVGGQTSGTINFNTGTNYPLKSGTFTYQFPGFYVFSLHLYIRIFRMAV